MPLLEIENLVVEFDTATGPFRAVDGISLAVNEREVLAINLIVDLLYAVINPRIRVR